MIWLSDAGTFIDTPTGCVISFEPGGVDMGVPEDAEVAPRVDGADPVVSLGSLVLLMDPTLLEPRGFEEDVATTASLGS